MRVIAVSDSHGSADRLRDAVVQALSRGSIDVLVHLGDGLDDLDMVMPVLADGHTRVIGVRGNNDWRRADGAEIVFPLDGVRFYACHGSQWGVKYGMERLMFAAREREAGVALYGHTHVSAIDFEYGIWFVNPGALCSPRKDGIAYAEILTNNGVARARLFRWL